VKGKIGFISWQDAVLGCQLFKIAGDVAHDYGLQGICQDCTDRGYENPGGLRIGASGRTPRHAAHEDLMKLMQEPRPAARQRVASAVYVNCAKP
jgi:hypothetical protein